MKRPLTPFEIIQEISRKALSKMEGGDARPGSGRTALPESALEIVLGTDTDKVLSEYFTSINGTSVRPIKTLSGEKMADIDVVVDTATPRLWAVRIKRRHDGAKA